MSRRDGLAKGYTAGGRKVPLWMATISHYMSGYGVFVFVGQATNAYMRDFLIGTSFTVPVFIVMIIGIKVCVPEWGKLNVFLCYTHSRINFNNHALL
jgi:hypothetical protein